MNKKAIVLVLDSFGVGQADDAAKFGDIDANTFLHIAQKYNLKIPNLLSMGLGEILKLSTLAKIPEYLDFKGKIIAKYGIAKELSFGKDTPSGHIEMMGVPVLFEWGYFKEKENCFPQKLIDDFCKNTRVRNILGNKHASGTEIIVELGEEHLKTGYPICYTSADSVFQIAAHEEIFGLDKLYEICKIARKLCDEYNIGRVIARPFLGENKNNFYRTSNRKDYAVPPPFKTFLDKLKDNGGEVVAVGKIGDIFAHTGTTVEIKAAGNQNIADKTIEAIKKYNEKDTLIFSNFVDFDMLFGHRRDVKGYAQALEYFDLRLPEIIKELKEDDILILTADHGCDPTFTGTDHTREFVPIICFGSKINPINMGKRETFADIGQTLAEYFNLESFEYGASFLK